MAENKNIRNGDIRVNRIKRENPGVDARELIGSRVPPHSEDAEKAVLSSLMLDRNAMSKVQEILNIDSFYDEKHRIIYESMLQMSANNIPVDIITLANHLKKNEKLDAIGGVMFLTEINSHTPTAANVEHHAHIVQEKYFKRLMIDTCGGILNRCYNESTDALEEIDKAESEIFSISEKRIQKSYLPLSDLAHEAYAMIEQLKEGNHPGLTGVPSGYTDLDNKLGGFQKSDFIIVAGRPSMGKTALALSIARNVAKEYKLPIAFFSLEMSSLQLVIRLISAEAKIDQQKIRTGRISQKDIQKIVKTLGRLAESPMIIDDSPILSIMELRAKARRLKVEHNIEMIVVDYLQFMNPPKADSREREISIISRSLKQLAKELNIPVIAVAQLNRSVESRADKRPMLSDLRESGSIEQDADVVLFVNRPEFYGIQTYEDKSPTEGTAEIIIGKQRNGPTGIVKLAYQKDFARFENLAYHYEEPPMANPFVEYNEEVEGPGF